MSNDNEKVICSICICSLACQDDSSVVTQCGHVYHITCINTWLRQPSKCPLCNEAVSLQQLKTVFLSVPRSAVSSSKTKKALPNAADKLTSSTSTNNQQINSVAHRNEELDKEIEYQFKIFQSDAVSLVLSKRTEGYIKILECLKKENEDTIRAKDIVIVALNEKLRKNSSRLDNYCSQMATIDKKNRKVADLKDEVTRTQPLHKEWQANTNKRKQELQLKINRLHALSMNDECLAFKRLDELERKLKTALEIEAALKKRLKISMCI
ncbi:uncharacterized protein B0P05DRAFT_641555 [Gilbertella persicaria]|uniref:uncharacterized protein n=1 Tax=Gilbertella persicaria TaxID=101096 RepID=UPI0022201D0E|nr:uncharacterized protein B0P05DRAFT_641555 [Gilbertella persicaria]KAI8051892.1 hypothetical protein B0P05DRAFT_641555 [Gilbertella persicaria]